MSTRFEKSSEYKFRVKPSKICIMKYTVLLFSFFLLGIGNSKEKIYDFDSRLSDIARQFKDGIMDADVCEEQKREADDLVDDIEEAIEEAEEENSDDLRELISLKKEAAALEEYIAAVGGCGNYIPTIKQFQSANRRLGGRVANVSIAKFCVNVISVTIDDYVAYLIENPSSKNYTVTYNWKTSSGMNSGNGTIGLSKKSVRHVYDNRENPGQKIISFIKMTCQEF